MAEHIENEVKGNCKARNFRVSKNEKKRKKERKKN